MKVLRDRPNQVLPSRSVTTACWILERLVPGPHAEALAGDLLEQVAAGRSARWLWFETVVALALWLHSVVSRGALPLLFAAAWSTVYPIWWTWSSRWLTAVAGHLLTVRLTALQWPGSAAYRLGSGLLPAIIFIWLGLLVYWSARSAAEGRLRRAETRAEVRRAFSGSLTALLLMTLLMMCCLGDPQLNVSRVAEAGFYTTLHLSIVSLPLTLSLAVALLLGGTHRSLAPVRTPRSEGQ